MLVLSTTLLGLKNRSYTRTIVESAVKTNEKQEEELTWVLL